MNYKQIIAVYWASPFGFIGLVYLIITNHFGFNIDQYIYIKAAIFAVFPISLPISLYEAYKYYKIKS